MKTRVIEIVLKAKDQASGKLKGLTGSVGGASKAMIALGVAAAAAAVAVGVAFVKMANAAIATVKEMTTLGDEFDKMSARTTIGVEDLIEWTFLMERAGGTAGSLEGAMRRLTKSMYDKSVGLSTAVRAWEEIGVATTDAEGNLRDVNSVLLDLADALSQMENQTKAMGLSQDLLGRGAAQMVVLLSQGRPELERQAALFRAINGQMGETFTKGAAAVIDAQTDMQYAIKGLKADLVSPIQPVLAESIDEIALAIGSFGRWVEGNQDVIKDFGDSLAKLTSEFVSLTVEVAKFTVTTGPKLAKVLEALTAPFTNNIKLARALRIGWGKLREDADETTMTISAMVEGMNEGLAINLRPDIQGAKESAGDAASEILMTVQEKFEAEAANLGVSLFTTAFDTETGNWVKVQKTLDELAKELTAKLASSIQETINQKIELAPDTPKNTDTESFGGPAALDDELMLIEDIKLLEEERAAQMASYNSDEVDALFEQEEINARLLEQHDEFLAAAEAEAQAQAALRDAVSDVAANFERLASDSISAMLKGEKGAVNFGKVLKGVVIDALSAVIVKLLVIQALKMFSGLGFFGSGGGVNEATPRAHGGGVSGYSIPDGPRGRDSVLIAAMPGEEVIDRTLSQRLRGFLAAQDSSAMVSPLSLAGGGGGASVVAHLNIARPVGYLDLLDLGEHAKNAAQLISEEDF